MIGQNFGEARKDVKRLIKKYSTRTSDGISNSIYIERDESFGPALMSLMASPIGRVNLYNHLNNHVSESRGRPWIASRIYTFATKIGMAPTFKEIATLKADKFFYLDIAKFRTWLNVANLGGNGRLEAIAMAACGFAVLQPELGADIYDVLASSSDEFSIWINSGEEEVLGEISSDLHRKLGNKPMSEHAPVPHLEIKIPLVETPQPVAANTTFCMPKDMSSARFHVESPALLAEQIGGWGDVEQFGTTLADVQHGEVTEQIKEASRRLLLIAQVLDSQRSQLELMKKRIWESSEELRKLPWFATPVECESVKTTDTRLTLSEVMEGLTRDYALSTQLLAIHGRLLDLYQAMRKPIEQLALDRTPTLDTVCDVLTEEIKATESMFKAWVSSEGRVADFVESLRESPLLELPPILAAMSGQLCNDLLRFVASTVAVSESGKRLAVLKGNLELAGIVLGLLREKGETDWLVFLRDSEITSLVTDIASFEKLFRFVDIPGMLEVGLEIPNVTPYFCALTARIAIHDSKPSALEYAAEFLESGFVTQRSQQVLTSLLTSFRRREFGKTLTVVRLMGADKSDPKNRLFLQQKLRLKELTSSPPGLHKIFHLLRVIAQTKFIKPIEEFLDQDDSDGALAKWESFGTLDEMVRATIRSSYRGREIEKRHELQTRNFLEIFDESLREWSGLQQPVPAAESQRLEALLSSLELGDSDERELLRIIRGNGADISKSLPNLRILGEQLIFAQKDGTFSLSQPEGLVSAFHQLCWPLMINGKAVPFLAYAVDRLSEMLFDCKPLSEVVGGYLAAAEFKSAQEASRLDPRIACRVDEIVVTKKSELANQHAELLLEAETAASEDEFIAMSLNDTRNAIDELQLNKIESNVEELKQLLVEFRSKKDPAYVRLLCFLGECEVEVSSGSSRADLEREVETIKSCESDRRSHLDQLRLLGEKHRISIKTKEKLLELVTKFDMPTKWLSQDYAALLRRCTTINYRIPVLTGWIS